MATTVHEPPKIEAQRDPSQSHGGFNSGGQDLVPGNLPAVKRYSPPPASTGIWVVLASITMTFAAFTSALIVRQGSALDWRHLTLPNILYVNTLVLFASSFALEMMPIRRAALPHDEGAGECGERHRDRPDADPHPRLCDATAECAVPSPVRHATDRPARRRWPRRQDRGAHWAAACIT